LKLTRVRVEKYKDVDRDENRHTFLKLPGILIQGLLEVLS